MVFLPSISDCPAVLISKKSRDSFHSEFQGCSGLLPALMIGVDERHVGEPNKSENVAQVRYLEIEGFCRGALLISASASSDDDDLLPLQQPPWAIWSVTERLPEGFPLR
jgi:hypothetical protein